MIINVKNRQKALKFSLSSVRAIVKQVLAEENQKCQEVSIYFVDTEEISELHNQFFNDPSPTDCISFPMDEEDDESQYRILGDVFVCPATAVHYAETHHLDPYEETKLYLVHGLLHLMGYDDIEEEEISLMRQAERRQMDQLHVRQLALIPLPPILKPRSSGRLKINPKQLRIKLPLQLSLN